MSKSTVKRGSAEDDAILKSAPQNQAAEEEREDDDLDWSFLPILDENDPDFDAYLRDKVQEALDDPRPSVPISEVTRRLEELYRQDMRESGLDP